MKRISFILVMLIMNSCFVRGQGNIELQLKKDTANGLITAKGKLPVFELDSCLAELFEAIAEADKKSSYYAGIEMFYSVDVNRRNGDIALNIWPDRWRKSSYLDYFGAIKIDDATFLCRGDYRSDSLFHPSKEEPIYIDLKRPVKITSLDDFDKAIDMLAFNPSLLGIFRNCSGLKINTHVYIEKKLPNFKMKNRKEIPEGKKNKSILKNSSIDNITLLYENAFHKLEQNIQDNGSFKESVFIVENTFFNNKLPLDDLDNLVSGLASLCLEWKNANSLRGYRFKDSSDLLTNLAIYKVLKDTVTAVGPGNEKFYHLPLTYDFNDFFGHQQWSNMFVSKLLVSQKGNCHSFPYLYKILADELKASCWLSFAPNHIYIKNRSKQLGWYNTELTSGSFPIDAWVTASGYIPIKAVQNGIYMDTLGNQQAIASCVLDLAKGYEFQTRNYEDGFILKCCNLTLQYHPANVQAMLLKAETLKRIYEVQEKEKSDYAGNTYQEMEQLYIKLFDLGYREMPEKMYMDWLLSVNRQKDKYSNNKVKQAFQKK